MAINFGGGQHFGGQRFGGFGQRQGGFNPGFNGQGFGGPYAQNNAPLPYLNTSNQNFGFNRSPILGGNLSLDRYFQRNETILNPTTTINMNNHHLLTRDFVNPFQFNLNADLQINNRHHFPAFVQNNGLQVSQSNQFGPLPRLPQHNALPGFSQVPQFAAVPLPNFAQFNPGHGQFQPFLLGGGHQQGQRLPQGFNLGGSHNINQGFGGFGQQQGEFGRRF